MSAISTGANPGSGRPLAEPSEREDLPDLPLTPREGWLTLIAVAVMMLAVGVAIDDATWAGNSLGTSVSQTKFLPVGALLGVFVGALLARSRLRPLSAHFVGALLGAMFLLYAIAGSISRAPAVEARLHDLNLSVSTFVYEVFVLGVRSSETSIFLLVIGSLVWAAAQFAAFSVFRRHRAGPAIVLAGLMMLINVSVTVRVEYAHLVVFVAAALLLLMRLNLFEQAREWRSRGMLDVADISNSFLRYGAAMVALAMVASILLAANASSAPLSRAWNNVDEQLVDIGYTVNRWLGGITGAARGPNVLFTPSQTIRDFWQSSTEPVFSVKVSDGVGRRWRGATYDSFDGRTWQQLDRQSVVVDPGAQILAQTAEGTPAGSGWQQVSAAITPAAFAGDVYVAPADPVSLDQPSEVLTNGAQGPFVAGKLAYGLQPGDTYTVVSAVRKTTGPNALTGNQLAITGQAYPAWVARYKGIRPESIGDTVAETAQQILTSLPSTKRDPYHITVAVQDYLYRTGGFVYTTDVRGMCDGQKLVDCFLTIKRGYCEYFATAMVMLLRELGVPSRYVLGYLPGHEQEDGSFRVDRSASHAWVEVYFAQYGWVEFDPTPGNAENGQQPTELAAGGPVTSPPPGDGGTAGGRGETECADPLDSACIDSADTPLPQPTAPPPPDQDLTLVFALGLLVLLGAGLLLVAAYRRAPLTEPDFAFNSLSRLATRLGYGPRPAQTTYEYADRLGELVPVARGDLRLIATAKVEATYAHRPPGESALRSLASAYRRARIGLLRLILRKPRLGRGPRQTGTRPD